MSKQPLKINDRFLIRCATQETNCTLKKINELINSSTFEIINNNADALNNMEVGNVLIECDKDIIIDDFSKVPELGRFVVEKDFDTVGGGIITNK
jgi:bifunctional enzyme CysN/CysC/sulfate adenylyltransferase subunit 1